MVTVKCGSCRLARGRARILNETGYTVIAAADFPDGALLLETGKWDALLTAVTTNKGAGPELAETARAMGIPTIFLAANIVRLDAHQFAGLEQRSLLLDLAARVKLFARTHSSHLHSKISGGKHWPLPGHM